MNWDNIEMMKEAGEIPPNLYISESLAKFFQ